MLIGRSSAVNMQLHQKSPIFWYQGLWKTIFPWVGLGGEGWFKQTGATDEASLAHLPLISRPEGQHFNLERITLRALLNYMYPKQVTNVYL